MKQLKAIVVILVSVLTAAAVCGCGRQKEETVNDKKEEIVYAAEYHPLNQKGYYISSPVFGENQNIFYLKSDGTEEKLISMDIGTADTKEIPITLPEENMNVSALGRDAEGNLLLGLTSFVENPDGWKLEQAMIKKMSADGMEISLVDIGSVFLNVPDFYVQFLLTDKDENYYICTGQDIYVLNPAGALLCRIPGNNYISNMFSMKDGRIVAAYYGDRGYELKEVSPAEKSMKELESSVSFDYGVYQSGVDTDLLYTQESVLYSCNLTDERPEKILQWIDYDVNSFDLQSFTILSDGRIAALTHDIMSGSDEWELVLLTPKDKSEVPEKEILTYGAHYISFWTERDIAAFNRQSDKYRIEVIEYGTSIDDKILAFSTDLTEGNAPDIIDLTYCPLPLETLISVGVVEDLNPYLDADDVIKREDYVESAMKAYERDGKLYGIMPYFGVDVLVGKVDNVGSGKSWTIDDMMKLADTRNGAQLLPGATKSGVLEIMCTMNQDMFVDEEAGSCDFMGEEFKKILEFANRFPAETDYDPNDSIIEKLKNDEILLYRDRITSVQMYQMYEFMFGGPVNIIGYPTFGESGLTFASNGTTVAMSSGSKNKEGVWEFIRFNLTRERQENVGSPNGGFPILRAALEKQFEEDMKAEYYEDADGIQKERPKATWSTMDVVVDVYAATGEQIDRMSEMIETARPNTRMESDIFAIINEEAQGYFGGQKSVDDVASIVQNRVQLYLNETR